MEKPNSRSNELLQRLEKLEDQNRRFKKLGILGIVILVAALIMGQAASKTRIIEAERFVLRDKNGFTRAELANKSDSAVGLYLYNPQSFKALKETAKAAGMEINDPPDVSLELLSDGSQKLRLGVIGAPNTEVYVSSEGGAGLNVSSKQGYFTRLGVESDGSPVLSLSGLDKRSVRFSYSEKGEPFLYIADTLDFKKRPVKDKQLIGLGISDEGNPVLFVNDKEGTIRAALFTKADGTPSLIFFDEKGAVQRQETTGTMQKSPMWVLWSQGMFAFGKEFKEWTIARGAWPTQRECETQRDRAQQGIAEKQAQGGVVIFTCLPDTVNLRGKP